MELIEIENRLNEIASIQENYKRNYTGETKDRELLADLIQDLATEIEIADGEDDYPNTEIQLPQSSKRSIIIPKECLGNPGQVGFKPGYRVYSR